VVYKNRIHDNGDWQSSSENDIHGIGGGGPTTRIWILENEMYHQGGDSVQFGHNQKNVIDHVYIGRNMMHEDRENAVDVKEASDVIVSENIMYGYRSSSTSEGAAVVSHYCPINNHIILNDIYDSQVGISITSLNSDCATPVTVRVIGNTIHNILGTAIQGWGSGKIVSIVGNTIYDIGGNGVDLDNLASGSAVENNILRDIDGLDTAFTGGTPTLRNNLPDTTDPRFISPTTGNFRLAIGSPAIDTGVASTAYTAFQSLYGISVSVDRDGNSRPAGPGWDLGAYESGGSIPPSDTTPPTVSVTSPISGATVAGIATLSAGASDNIAVSYVQFRLDGVNIGSSDNSAPYSMSWDSTAAANGQHTLSAIAADAAGNTASSSIIITVLNALPAQGTGLVASYNFDEGSGSVLTDFTGTNDGLITEAVWAGGHTGGALNFDGVNDLVTIPDANILDLAAVTLEAWVYPTSFDANYDVVILKEPNGQYGLYSNSPSNLPMMSIYTSSPQVLNGASQLPANTWSHLAQTYDGSNMRLYVNGVQVATRAQTGSISASAEALRMGGAGSGSYSFAGRIDDVRIYNRSLSQADIQLDMTTPVAGGVAVPPDTTPPTISSGQPSGTLAPTTVSVILQTLTDEAATCRYSTSPDVVFDLMTNVFTTTGGISHLRNISGIVGGSSYNYYVRCNDTSGNVNMNDYLIAFAVANATTNTTNITGDVNRDGSVNLADLQLVVNDFGKTAGFASGVDMAAPYSRIDLFDIMMVVKNWGRVS
jgi:hypothetical protein